MVVIVVDTKEEFDTALKEAGDKAVLVDFFATWCGPCKMIAPILEAMSNDTSTMVFLKVDVDTNDAVAQEQNISAMPTFKVFKNGQMVEELVGANKDKVTALVNKYK